MKIPIPALSVAVLLVTVAVKAAGPAASSESAKAPALAVTPTPIAATSSDKETIVKAAHSLGYKTRQHEGKTVYCKSETKAGTTFPSLTCLTEDQVMASVKRSEGNKDSVETLQRTFRTGAPPQEPQMGMRGN